jgi:hypothetical protein
MILIKTANILLNIYEVLLLIIYIINILKLRHLIYTILN